MDRPGEPPPMDAELRDQQFMSLALEQAKLAQQEGEVPVGAIVVHENQVIGAGYNQPIATHDPSAHAEMRAIRAAAQRLGNYRLPGCELYVTLEPCAMCAGVIQHARLSRLVYGAADPKTGACGSVVDLFGVPQLAHHAELRGGVLGEASSAMLREFFAQRRAEQRGKRTNSRPGQRPVGSPPADS